MRTVAERKDGMRKSGGFGRRDFFKGACAAGFMVATSELPAATEGAKFEVGKRGPHSRLATSYAVVDIGLPKPFSVTSPLMPETLSSFSCCLSIYSLDISYSTYYR